MRQNSATIAASSRETVPGIIRMNSENGSQIDWFIFLVGTALLLAVVIPIVVAPDWSIGIINAAFQFITSQFGVYYVMAASIIFVFLLWLGVSRFGGIVLGPQGTTPAYSKFSWAAMLFCTGIGGSLIYWGAAEWAFYISDPPYGIQPDSDAAVVWASTYGMFHWGPVAWGLYCLPTIAFCCSYHIREVPILRLSAACGSALGRYTDRWPGRVIDLFFIVGLLGTAATGLAFGTSIVSSSITKLTGLPDDFRMQLVILILATSLIAYSVYRGLDKGIKVLSLINASLVLLFIAFVLVVGPTAFILEMGVTSIGHMFQNFIKMTTWTDPLRKAQFVETWTIFYWAWWIALGPFVGMFVAKISRGRTVREVVFGMLGWGSIGCALFFIVLGNYSLDLELNGVYPVKEQALGESPSTAIAAIIELLPFGSFWLFFIAVVGIIFTATTYDSASYTLSAGATRYLKADEHPLRAHRVYWAIALGSLPAALLFLRGLTALQTASVVASVPILIIYVLLAWSIVKTLRLQSE